MVLALGLAAGCAGPTGAIEASCSGPRVLITDLSSQERSPAAVREANEVMTAHLLAAAVCDEPVLALGVAGGSQAKLFDTDNPISGEITGPNTRARTKQARNLQPEARRFVSAQLAAAFRAHPKVDTTSVPALYAAAAEHASAATRVVLLTTGVNIDDRADLNRPLPRGEGRRLAQGLSVAPLPRRSRVVVIGVAQMDAARPAPGATWAGEVRSFNEVLCDATGAACTVLSVASADQTLV